MAEKKEEAKTGIKIENGYAELKPSIPGKKPTQVCIGAKTYKGDYIKLVGEDEKGKPITETITSKVKFVPEQFAKQLPEKLFL